MYIYIKATCYEHSKLVSKVLFPLKHDMYLRLRVKTGGKKEKKKHFISYSGSSDSQPSCMYK